MEITFPGQNGFECFCALHRSEAADRTESAHEQNKTSIAESIGGGISKILEHLRDDLQIGEDHLSQTVVTNVALRPRASRPFVVSFLLSLAPSRTAFN